MDFAEADALNLGIRRLALRHRARAHELLAPLGLRPGQEFVLMELRERGGRSQAKLADALSCAPPSVSLMVGKLEAAGYVRRTRQDDDRRAVLVELTDAGTELTDRLRALWITLAEETVGDYRTHSPTGLAGILTALADHFAPAAAEAP